MLNRLGLRIGLGSSLGWFQVDPEGNRRLLGINRIHPGYFSGEGSRIWMGTLKPWLPGRCSSWNTVSEIFPLIIQHGLEVIQPSKRS